MREEAHDGRKRIRRPGWITPEGDGEELGEQVVGDLLGDPYVVLLAELEEVFLGPVGELKASPLRVVDRLLRFGLEGIHRLFVEAWVVAIGVGSSG